LPIALIQSLKKPCGCFTFEFKNHEYQEMLFTGKAMSDEASLENVLNHVNKLPTLPGIALKILEAVQKEDPDLNEIADILSMDPPLSAEILKMVNSGSASERRDIEDGQFALLRPVA
jgi:hypothetical protein